MLKDCHTRAPTIISQIGMGPLMKAKALKKDGASLVRSAAAFEDETRGLLQRVKEGGGAADAVPEEVAKGLRKRQLVSQVGGVLLFP